jgi:undecaprenyl-diphosphatase
MELTKNPFSPFHWFPGVLLGVCFPLSVFIVLASHVWHQGKGFVWDVPVLTHVHATANPMLDQLALTLTPLGIGWGILPTLTILGGMLIYQRRWRSLLYLIVMPLGSALLNRALKLYFHRERPHLWEVFTPDLSYAFPSGHAMGSASLVMVCLVLAWNTPWRWLVLPIGSLYLLLIGWTRIYLGMHYPSDILAGWLLTIAWATSTWLIIQPQQATNHPQL